MGSFTLKLWKWVTNPLCQQKMGSLQRQQNSYINNHEKHITCITMNRSGHLYKNIPYSKHTVYIEYKSVATHSHSLTHTSADQPTSVQ